MNCRQVNSLISAYLDGELAGVEMLSVKRHLSICPGCAEEFESIRDVKRLMAGLGNVAPKCDIAAVIGVKLDECRVSSCQRVWNSAVRYGRSHWSPAAAALGAVGVALMLMTAGSLGEYQPGTVAAQRGPVVSVQPIVESGLGQLRIASVSQPPAVPVEPSSWIITTADYVRR